MKTITKLKLTFFFACFITFNFSAIAGNTIRMITRCAGWVSHSIVVTNTKQFTVDWGDGSSIESFTGTGNSQSLTHNYLNSGRYEVTFSGTSTDCSFLVFNADRADTLDLSSCPSIQKIIQNPALGTLRSLNTNNCTHLEEIHVSGNLLTVLDLKDNIALKQLICQDNQLTHINLVSNEI